MKELLTRESMIQVFAMTCEADLERRMKEVAERENVPNDRLIPFFVVMPDNFDNAEQQKWVKDINEALATVAKDAHLNIMTDRTIKTMEDLGLGDHNSAGWADA